MDTIISLAYSQDRGRMLGLSASGVVYALERDEKDLNTWVWVKVLESPQK